MVRYTQYIWLPVLRSGSLKTCLPARGPKYQNMLKTMSTTAIRFFVTSSPQMRKVIPTKLKGKKVSSQLWMERQLSDPYVDKAKRLNYRCRSAFKLIEMDDRFKIFRPGQTVIDCGAAPGSWTQVAVDRVNAGRTIANKDKGMVIAVDKQPLFPVEGAIILGNADFTIPQLQDKIKELLDGKTVDVVLSDMAPSATGIHDMDSENIIHLCYATLRFAAQVSVAEATIIVKLWECNQRPTLEADMLRFYKNVRVVKPDSSRSDSAEIFLLGRGFKGLKNG